MKDLNDNRIKLSDKSAMLQKILEFPNQLQNGWKIADKKNIILKLYHFKNIVFSGMGGSAIAGDMILSILEKELPIPLIVNRDYQIPNFANSYTLFIASSYSGNTEETISTIQEAIIKKCSILCITSGGRLGEIAKEKGLPLFQLPSGYPPRAALGYSLGVLLNFFSNLGVGNVSEEEINNVSSFLKKKGTIWKQIENKDNLPLALAKEIQGKIPLIYSSADRLESVGLRWKTQLNENSKTHAFYQPFPEMNHNEIMGWNRLNGTENFLSRLLMIILKIPDDHSRIKLRMKITKELVQKNGGKVIEMEGEGSSFMTRLLYLVHLGDIMSFYLAVLYGVDPTEIQNIKHLKKGLAQST